MCVYIYMYIYIRCVYISLYYIYICYPQKKSSIYAFILFGNVPAGRRSKRLWAVWQERLQQWLRKLQLQFWPSDWPNGLWTMRQDVFSSYCQKNHSFCLFIDQMVRGGMRSFGAAIRHQSKILYLEMQVLGVSNVGNMQTASKSLFKLPSMVVYTYG